MTADNKVRNIRLIIYVIVGFTTAFLCHYYKKD